MRVWIASDCSYITRICFFSYTKLAVRFVLKTGLMCNVADEIHVGGWNLYIKCGSSECWCHTRSDEQGTILQRQHSAVLWLCTLEASVQTGIEGCV